MKSSLLTAVDFFKSSCSDASHFDVVSFCIFCSAETSTKILGFALYNSALKWALNDSHAFMVLEDDAEHSDQTGGEKWSLHDYNFLAGSRKTVPLACRSGDWI